MKAPRNEVSAGDLERLLSGTNRYVMRETLTLVGNTDTFYRWQGQANPTLPAGAYPNVGGAYNPNPGDLIFVFLASDFVDGAEPSPIPPAPFGWTLDASGIEEASGSAIGLYHSTYDPSNAPINSESFPYNVGFFLTASYPAGSYVQRSDLVILPTGGSASITVPALPDAAEANSRLVAFLGTRHDGEGFGITSADGMNTVLDVGFNYYSAAIFDQTINLSGSRTFNKFASIYTTWGVMVEVGYAPP